MIIVPTPPPTRSATRHSRELGKRVEQLIRDYQREHPELTDDEIRAALAQSSLTSDDDAQALQQRRKLVVTVAVGLAVAGLIAGTVLDKGAGAASSGFGSGEWPVLSITIAVVVVAFAVIRMISRR
jgi:hypothetical protein